ncbi:hypothetical protein HOK51_07920 [Candidatus Woesearchaeota archaeon]|jgi:hypothetical protein|nr:hypothetical protein [Candidatus Woesearchaeota archaeon]MBT6519752.1 hypothetical protein [Candidatus Woesearchaeota archaeon]
MKNNLALKKLNGIKPKGIKSKADSPLEYLLDYNSMLMGSEYLERDLGFYQDPGDVYTQIYNDLKNDYLTNFEFTKDHLDKAIVALPHRPITPGQQILTGLYSGVLLEILFERNKQENKPTRFHFNGQGTQFDYLFRHVRNFDELIIENFKGTRVCSRAAIHGGKGNLLVFLNNSDTKTKHASLGSEPGSYGGHVNSVFYINNDYNSMGSSIGDCGSVNFTIGVNNNGSQFNHHAHNGNNIATFLVDCIGEFILSGSDLTKLKSIYLSNITAESAFVNNKVKYCLLYKSRINEMGRILLTHPDNKAFFDKFDLCYSKTPNLAGKIKNKSRVRIKDINKDVLKIIELSKTLQNQSYPHIIKDIYKINKLLNKNKMRFAFPLLSDKELEAKIAWNEKYIIKK